MKAFKYFVFLFLITFSFTAHSAVQYGFANYSGSSPSSVISQYCSDQIAKKTYTKCEFVSIIADRGQYIDVYVKYVRPSTFDQNSFATDRFTLSSWKIACPSATSVDLKVPTSSGSYVCTGGCQYKLRACVDVDFESGMTCSATSTGQDCGTPKPPESSTNPPATQDPTNPTDKTEEQTTFENIMNVIGEKLDGIKDAITGGNQNQDGGDTGGSTGGNTGGDVNVDMSETNAKIDETNSLIDELTKWLQGEDLGDDIFGDSEPPEKELTPQQLDTDIFSGASQCPTDAKLNFKLLGGKSFTKTFEFRVWCDKLEIFGSLILIFSYLFGAYIIVSKS